MGSLSFIASAGNRLQTRQAPFVMGRMGWASLEAAGVLNCPSIASAVPCLASTADAALAVSVMLRLAAVIEWLLGAVGAFTAGVPRLMAGLRWAPPLVVIVAAHGVIAAERRLSLVVAAMVLRRRRWRTELFCRTKVAITTRQCLMPPHSVLGLSPC